MYVINVTTVYFKSLHFVLLAAVAIAYTNQSTSWSNICNKVQKPQTAMFQSTHLGSDEEKSNEQYFM